MVDSNPTKEPMLVDGRTALHYGASTGDRESVAELLAAGSVDANAQDAVGYSAVQIAAAEGHLDVLRLLLRHNADVNLHDNLVSYANYTRCETLRPKPKSPFAAGGWLWKNMADLFCFAMRISKGINSSVITGGKAGGQIFPIQIIH